MEINSHVQFAESTGIEVIEAQDRALIDTQIATAKKYPRVLSRVLNQIETYATMDTETAEDCFYALISEKEEKKNGEKEKKKKKL